MLKYTTIFLLIALIAALLGLGEIVTIAAGIAIILFAVFMLLAVISIVNGMLRSRRRSRTGYVATTTTPKPAPSPRLQIVQATRNPGYARGQVRIHLAHRQGKPT